MRRSSAVPACKWSSLLKRYWQSSDDDVLCPCRAGRQLIYSLSQKHRNSLVLNYAIQRILQAGHEDEVANLGSSLASYFSVVHRLLTNRLKQVPQADAALLQSLAFELKVRSLGICQNCSPMGTTSHIVLPHFHCCYCWISTKPGLQALVHSECHPARTEVDSM